MDMTEALKKRFNDELINISRNFDNFILLKAYNQYY